MKERLKHIKKYTAFTLVLVVLFSLGMLTGQVYQPIADAAPQSPTTLLGGRSLDGNVSVIEVSDDIAYLGGNFSSVGFESAYAAVINSTDGALVNGELAIDDSVYAVALDGSGGWYIGGTFTSVAGEERNYLAHIESDGSLDETWNPDPDDVINEITVSGSDIFVSGDFTTIGGQSRTGLAKLNNTNGNADATWNPNPDDYVTTIAVSGSDIYVGGGFTSIGGQSRNYAAKLNNTNGNADATWNPGSDNSVTDIAITGSDIYVVGSFTEIGGQSRNYAAKLNNTNGNADVTWNPDPDDRPVFIELSGSDIYTAGHFFDIGGQSRTKIAKLNNTNGNADPVWSAEGVGYDGGIYSLAVSGSAVYFGADFTSIGGLSRLGIAKLNTTNGATDSDWDAKSSSYQVNDIAVSGSSVYVGGAFDSIGGTERNGLAAIDLTTNELTDWNPNVSGEVNALEISGSDVYVGGEFTTVGGETRNNLAKVDIDTGEVDATWDPGPNNLISALAIIGTDIYVSGGFTTIGGLSRDNVAKLNSTNGNADAAFDMSTYFNGFGQFPAIDALGSYLYLASTSAVTIDLVQYRSVYRVNRTTGVIDTTWVGSCSACGGADAYFVKVISPYIYVSGNFASYQAGAPSGRLVRLNLDGSVDTSWTPASDERVLAIIESGSTIYVGGSFEAIGGQSRTYLAALNRTSGLAESSWAPSLSNTVSAIGVYESSLLVGGSFSGNLKRYDFPAAGFTSTNQGARESAGSVSVPIALSSTSDLETTVDYTITSGTATAGTDVTQTSGTITIGVGDTISYLQLELVDDPTPESDETFTITLSNPTNSFLDDQTTLIFTISGESETTSTGSYTGGGGGGGSIVIPPSVPPVIDTPQAPGIPTPASPTTPALPQPMSPTFTRDLQYGSNGTDVTLLQQFLNRQGFTLAASSYGSPGNETIYFRGRTMRALKRFQQAYINTVQTVTGRLEGATRDLINYMY